MMPLPTASAPRRLYDNLLSRPPSTLATRSLRRLGTAAIPLLVVLVLSTQVIWAGGAAPHSKLPRIPGVISVRKALRVCRYRDQWYRATVYGFMVVEELVGGRPGWVDDNIQLYPRALPLALRGGPNGEPPNPSPTVVAGLARYHELYVVVRLAGLPLGYPKPGWVRATGVLRCFISASPTMVAARIRYASPATRAEG
jgi:hypothetical protein